MLPSCHHKLYQPVISILAYLLLCLSFFVDASNDPVGPQFPSYNTIIGIWACIICCRTKGAEDSLETALTDVSTFVSVGATSLVFDVVFSGVWGPGLLRGDNNAGGTRLTFIVFTIAMAVKAMLLLACATRIVLQNRSASARSEEVRGANGSLSESRFVDVEAPIEMEGGFHVAIPSRKNDATQSLSPQPPSFSPGLPGLISPGPTALSSQRIIETP